MRPAINQGGGYVARQLLSDEGRGFGSTFTMHSEGSSHPTLIIPDLSGITLPTLEGKLTRTRMACSTLDKLLGLGQQQQKTVQLDPACRLQKYPNQRRGSDFGWECAWMTEGKFNLTFGQPPTAAGRAGEVNIREMHKNSGIPRGRESY